MTLAPVETLRIPRFAVGDLARLRCEHTRMVVEKVEGDTIHCVYMTNSMLIIRDSFPSLCLVSIREQE